jgi:hypothetical protein
LRIIYDLFAKLRGIVKEALNKSLLRFDTFSVRPECRAQRGVSKGRTENADETTSHLTKPLKRQVIGYHHERSYSALP